MTLAYLHGMAVRLLALYDAVRQVAIGKKVGVAIRVVIRLVARKMLDIWQAP